MAGNPLPVHAPAGSELAAVRATRIVGTVTAAAASIEQVIAASAGNGALDIGAIGQLTALFGNLAGVAIQAAHDMAGKPVTPESVLALMPGATPLVNARTEGGPAS